MGFLALFAVSLAITIVFVALYFAGVVGDVLGITGINTAFFSAFFIAWFCELHKRKEKQARINKIRTYLENKLKDVLCDFYSQIRHINDAGLTGSKFMADIYNSPLFESNEELADALTDSQVLYDVILIKEINEFYKYAENKAILKDIVACPKIMNELIDDGVKEFVSKALNWYEELKSLNALNEDEIFSETEVELFSKFNSSCKQLIEKVNKQPKIGGITSEDYREHLTLIKFIADFTYGKIKLAEDINNQINEIMAKEYELYLTGETIADLYFKCNKDRNEKTEKWEKENGDKLKQLYKIVKSYYGQRSSVPIILRFSSHKLYCEKYDCLNSFLNIEYDRQKKFLSNTTDIAMELFDKKFKDFNQKDIDDYLSEQSAKYEE